MSSDPALEQLLPLASVTRNLFNSGIYSDIEVVCGDGQKLKCHKLVLSQSKVLSNSFDPSLGFKESTENVIKLTEDAPAAVKAMVEYLYTFTYASLATDQDQSAALIFHVTMYAMGEIYAIEGLKDLAKNRFHDSAKGSVPAHVLAPAIKSIYESTPDSDRGLREVALSISGKRPNALLTDEKFKAMMDEVGPFGKDLLLNSRGLYEWETKDLSRT